MNQIHINSKQTLERCLTGIGAWSTSLLLLYRCHCYADNNKLIRSFGRVAEYYRDLKESQVNISGDVSLFQDLGISLKQEQEAWDSSVQPAIILC